MGVPTSSHDANPNPPSEAPTDCSIGTASTVDIDAGRGGDPNTARPPMLISVEGHTARGTPPRPNRIGGVRDGEDDYAVRNGRAFRKEDPISARRRDKIDVGGAHEDNDVEYAVPASIGRFLLPEVEDLNFDRLILGDTSAAMQTPSPPPSRPPSPPTHPPRESSSCLSSTYDDSTAALSMDEDDIEDKNGGFGRLFLQPAAVWRDSTNHSLRRIPKKSILKRDDSSCGSSSSSKTSVYFHSVEVREYDRTVGDHPSCRSGPPVSTLSSDSCLHMAS